MPDKLGFEDFCKLNLSQIKEELQRQDIGYGIDDVETEEYLKAKLSGDFSVLDGGCRFFKDCKRHKSGYGTVPSPQCPAKDKDEYVVEMCIRERNEK